MKNNKNNISRSYALLNSREALEFAITERHRSKKISDFIMEKYDEALYSNKPYFLFMEDNGTLKIIVAKEIKEMNE